MLGSVILLGFLQNIPLPRLGWTLNNTISYKVKLDSIGSQGVRKATYCIELTPIKSKSTVRKPGEENSQLDETEKKGQILAVKFTNLGLKVNDISVPLSKNFGVATWASNGAGLLSDFAVTGGAGEYSFPAFTFFLPEKIDGRGNWALDVTLPEGVPLKVSGKLNHRRFAATLTASGKLKDVDISWTASFDPQTQRMTKSTLKMVQGEAKADYEIELISPTESRF